MKEKTELAKTAWKEKNIFIFKYSLNMKAIVYMHSNASDTAIN